MISDAVLKFAIGCVVPGLVAVVGMLIFRRAISERILSAKSFAIGSMFRATFRKSVQEAGAALEVPVKKSPSNPADEIPVPNPLNEQSYEIDSAYGDLISSMINRLKRSGFATEGLSVSQLLALAEEKELLDNHLVDGLTLLISMHSVALAGPEDSLEPSDVDSFASLVEAAIRRLDR